jgi:hypothetical protein
VPTPGGKGDVVHGIAGRPPEETHAWIALAKKRLAARWGFCPEMLTHNLVVDLKTGAMLPVDENTWSETQTRETLTPYCTRALQLLKDAGVDATGFTSPWVFGIKVEPEYIAAMVAAQRAVYGREESWYFLHMNYREGRRRPWVAAPGLVSVPATVTDHWWKTIDDPRVDTDFLDGIAAAVIADTREVIADGEWPIWVTHWQSLWSNGTEAGLRALERAALRANELDVEWKSVDELMRMTLDGEADRAA